jgi:hypothetical protein
MGSLRSWHAKKEAELSVYTPRNGTSPKMNIADARNHPIFAHLSNAWRTLPPDWSNS